jgi:ribose transport system permease protein
MSTLEATPVSGQAARPSPVERLRPLQQRWAILQILAILVVFGYGAMTLDGLATWASIKVILALTALVGLAATGQTLLILMGGFDLSISGIMVASALIVTALADKLGWSLGFALAVSIVGAAALGAAAGQICHRFQIQPLIVTLATGAIAAGLVQAATGGVVAGSAPAWLTKLASPGSTTFGIDIPPTVAIWTVVAIAMAIFLHRTVGGRRLMATGANSQAAEFSLISTRRVWTIAFAFSAIGSALVGLLVAGFSGSVDPTLGQPYLFQSVVAVIVGGTVFGGPGDYSRTVIGALFVTVLTIVLVGHGASAAAQQIVYGLAILVAVAIYGRERRLRDQI